MAHHADVSSLRHVRIAHGIREKLAADGYIEALSCDRRLHRFDIPLRYRGLDKDCPNLALGDEIDAAVMYYGRTVDDRAELAKLQAPLLGLFGGADEGIPVSGVRAMEAALHELGKQAEIVIYDGADHAFANPSGERYQPDAATDSWRRTTEFFERHLR